MLVRSLNIARRLWRGAVRMSEARTGRRFPAINIITAALNDPANLRHMRVRLVGMKHHGVAVLKRELLGRKIAYGLEDLFRRRPRRHRKHQFVNQLGRANIRTWQQLIPSSMLINVQIPILEQRS